MKTLSFLFFVLLFLSCKQEEDNITIIGEKNKNFNIIEPVPEMSILDSGKDSLDLDSDGTFDIVFIKSPKPAISGYASETTISVKNGLQIALSSTNNYPDTLNINTIVNNNLTWSANEPSQLTLQSFDCTGSHGCVSYANFLNVSAKYIGYKSEQKFGWIKVDNTAGELKIKEYTVLK